MQHFVFIVRDAANNIVSTFERSLFIWDNVITAAHDVKDNVDLSRDLSGQPYTDSVEVWHKEAANLMTLLVTVF